MAGEAETHQGKNDTNVVLLMEQTAFNLLPESGLGVGVIEARDSAGPDTMRVHPATVDKDLCAHCLACVKLCPSLSWDMQKTQVVVNEVSCKGCGICGSVCPAGAISQRQFSMRMVLDAIDGLWDTGGNGALIEGCNTCPVEPLGIGKMRIPEVHGFPIRIVCSGRVEPIHVLETAQMGARGLLMMDCFANVKEKDRFERGKKRLESGARLLETLGSPEVRTEAVRLNADSARDLPSVIRELSAKRGLPSHGGSV